MRAIIQNDMATPRFSVITPTLNEEKFLPSLLDSLVTQTHKPFEVIVVDGKSKDKTVAVAQSFAKKLPIRVIACERASLPMQRNRGASAARGQWFVFVDADSVLLPYCMERLAAFVRDTRVSLCTSWCRPDSDTPADAILVLLANMGLEGSTLVKRPFFSPGPMTAASRAAWTAAGGYDEKLAFGEDIDFSRRIADQGFACGIMRETLYIWSLRRFRQQGRIRVVQAYVKGLLSVLLTRKPPKNMPGYAMGGQLYARHR